MKYAKFDETVEAHVRLNLKKSQSVRDTVVFPHQFRGEKKDLVFCKPDKEKEAMDAGAACGGGRRAHREDQGRLAGLRHRRSHARYDEGRG